jgi:hypothetical protein
MGTHTLALLQMLDTELTILDRLTGTLLDHYREHPSYPIISSFPALGGQLGARILAEIGDDPERFNRPWSLSVYAGAAPVTYASGTATAARRRTAYNHWLGDAVTLWGLPLRVASPAAKAYYDQRRAHGDRYGTAVRKLTNKYLTLLQHCLATTTEYQEPTR